jgi:hypothetical protein
MTEITYKYPVSICPLCEWQYIGKLPIKSFREHIKKEHAKDVE